MTIASYLVEFELMLSVATSEKLTEAREFAAEGPGDVYSYFRRSTLKWEYEVKINRLPSPNPLQGGDLQQATPLLTEFGFFEENNGTLAFDTDVERDATGVPIQGNTGISTAPSSFDEF